jgi:outer membrane immunogenic protein
MRIAAGFHAARRNSPFKANQLEIGYLTMKRFDKTSGFAVLGVAVLALTGPASAADLGGAPARSMKDDPGDYRPAFSWTGLYAGLHAGYGFSGSDNIETTGQAAANVGTVASGARPGSVNLERRGFLGGGQAGYNWQMNGIVFGIEADISKTDLEETTRVATNVGGVRNNDFRSRLDYLGTVRGRVGVALDNSLFFFTAGLAYGDVENSANFFGTAGSGGVRQFTGSSSGVETGYAVGGGVEHAFAAHWTFKAEYLYYDLGSNTVGVNLIPGSGGVGTGYNSRFDNDGHIVRAGLNHKF